MDITELKQKSYSEIQALARDLELNTLQLKKDALIAKLYRHWVESGGYDKRTKPSRETMTSTLWEAFSRFTEQLTEYLGEFNDMFGSNVRESIQSSVINVSVVPDNHMIVLQFSISSFPSDSVGKSRFSAKNLRLLQSGIMNCFLKLEATDMILSKLPKTTDLDAFLLSMDQEGKVPLLDFSIEAFVNVNTSIYFQLKIVITPIGKKISISDVLALDSKGCNVSKSSSIIRKADVYHISTYGTLEQIQARIDLFLHLNSNRVAISLLTHTEALREHLNLEGGVWRCLPTDLFMLSFVHEAHLIPRDLKEVLLGKYFGHDDYELFEFVGDSVLEVIVRDRLMLRNTTSTPGSLSRMSSMVVRNSSLNCMMREKGLCDKVITSQKDRVAHATDKDSIKICADVLEAMLGVLYHYLTKVKPTSNPMKHIGAWLDAEWKLNEIIEDVEASAVSKHTYCNPCDTKSGVCGVNMKGVSEERKQFRTDDDTVKHSVDQCNVVFNPNMRVFEPRGYATDALHPKYKSYVDIRYSKGSLLLFDNETKERLVCFRSKNTKKNIRDAVMFINNYVYDLEIH